MLGYFNQKNISYLIFIVGPVMAVLYFSIFYWMIGYFNFKTPGREDEDETAATTDTSSGAPSSSALQDKAAKVLVAIGGANNIRALEACITRLRLQLHDSGQVDQPALKRLGASGVMNAGGGNVQIVFGVESDFLKTEIQKIIQSGDGRVAAVSSEKTIPLPIPGKIIPANEIPDETFSQEIMGQTLGILPSEGSAYAPFDGEVSTLFHTNHALGLTSVDGVELLIHVGIDTVKMNGNGFKAFVKTGDKIKKGQKLLDFDLKLIQNRAKSVISPVVVTNPDQVKGLQKSVTGDVLWKYN
jgi:glucose-specific phosphotransferase system IIA component